MVKCKLRCMGLKSVRMNCTFVWEKSKIRRMSSTLTEAVDDHVFFSEVCNV